MGQEDDPSEVLDLPAKTILKGMIELGHLFYLDSKKLSPSFEASKYENENLKIDTKEKNILIGSSTSLGEKEKILMVLQEYIDVIS